MQQASTKKHQSAGQGRANLILQLDKNRTADNPVKKRRPDTQAPLSYAQQRLWIMSQLEPDNPIYNMAGAIRFNGALNTEALQQSLDEVVRRHEILRTRFVDEQGQARQCVMSESGLTRFRLDLTDSPQAAFDDCAEAFIRAPFDLSAAAPLRVMLAVLGKDRHTLVLVLHHIAADRWSVGLMMKEVAALYERFSKGLPSSLPEPTIQYGDFCVWQAQQVERWEKQLSYWTQKLHNGPPLLELPTDRPRPLLQSYRGDLYEFSIGQSLGSAVKALCKQHNATLFMVMAAAFNSLLYRYTGSKDMTMGYPVAGRNQAQIADLIGFFVNTLVLRCQLSDDMPFSALLNHIRNQALQDQMHADFSFGQLVEALNPVRHADHTPLFQVMLAVQNVPTSAFEIPDLSATPLNLNNHAAQFDLTLFIEESDGQLQGLFEYNTDLFDAATVARMAGHLQTLLAGAVMDPNLPIAQLPLLTDRERQQLFFDWNRPSELSRSCPPMLVHQRFEAQAKAAPEKTALVFAGQTLSYGELDSRASSLADALNAGGIGPESRVGVSAERSLQLIVGLLAVLKAGAAYVPLDPGYPDERLDYMLQDAGIKLLLTQAHLAERFRRNDIEMILLDHISPLPGPLPEGEGVESRFINCAVYINNAGLQRSPKRASTENTAYIIYTSGSTGMPKGVSVSHGNLLHSTEARSHYYQDSVQCFLLLSSFAFDSSVAGIFWTLSQGGRLCLPQPDELNDPVALAQLIKRQQVSHLLALPSFYSAIINERSVYLLASLKAVIVAGEACSGEIAAQHHRQLPKVKFYNEYGPTEGTVWSSVWHSETADPSAMLSIGRPIEGVQIYMLDRYFQPVPAGISGELCIGGSGLARGYINRPELTAEKFIPNPFGATPGGRLYKTGDLARYRADGSIEFLGRVDNQVKIRGYRIEPGEIENRLLQYPGIREAAVLAREDGAGHKRLVAYLVSGEQPLPESQLLQCYLKQSLPEYMVPSVFMGLERLPLTPNGKLDRRVLPHPGLPESDKRVWAAPRNATEQALVDIWSDLLCVQRLSIHDNFFSLGGDSILSIQAVSRAHQAGLTLTPRQLFQYQTVAELAAAVIGTDQDKAGKIAAEQGRVTGSVPLTPIQYWFFELGLNKPQYWNQSVLLRSALAMEPVILQQAIEQLVDYHDVLHLAFTGQDGDLQAVHQNELAWGFLCVDLDNVEPDQRSAYIESICSERQQSLDPATGPLMSLVLFDSREAGAQRLFWTIHHLVVDAVSWRILLEDLHTVYRQLADGQAVVLPAKTTSFQQWATQLSAYAKSASLQKEADYWLGRPKTTLFPVDYPQGCNSEASAASCEAAITQIDTEALLQQVPAVYRTRINDILLAALGRSLADWSGNDAVCIDLESHGREALFDDIDLSRTVGWFSSVYPLVLMLPEGSEPGRLIMSVKEQLRQVPANGIGYGLLRYLDDQETGSALKRQPAAQVIFNYLGRLDSALPKDSPYQLANENGGASSDADNRRAHELEVIAKIRQGQLQVSFKYSKLRFHAGTIEALAQTFQQQLQQLIRHCQSPEAGGYTPSDFPLARISQQELDGLALTPARVADIYPLTPLQQGLVFHSLYAREPGAYCLLLGCRLQGTIDIPAFKQAWQYTIARHSILRTGFLVKDTDTPLQFVCRNGEVPWSEWDWRSLPETEQQQHWQGFQDADWQAGFDFLQPPLMRLTLIRCAEDRHYLAWSFHHLLQDGWSMSLILKDVFDAYQALCAGRELRLPTSKPYRDYIEWLQRQDMAAAEHYWRNALAGFSAPTPLFGANKAEATATEVGYGLNSLTFSTDATARLQTFVQSQRLTLNTLIQGAWAIVLSRYSGERDVLFGVTVAGRPTELDGIEDMVGLFINTLPLRVRVPDSVDSATWLQQLLEQNMTLRQYEYTPLVNINGWSEIPPGQPLFDSLLVFENYPADRLLKERIGNLAISDMEIKDQTNYPLTVTALPGPNLEIAISYDRSYVNEQAVIRLLGHFENSLEGLVDVRTTRLSELCLLSDAENRQILHDWNATQVGYPQDLSLQQLFERQAATRPDAVAVAYQQDFLSYAELNAKANQLAHYLLAQGIGPDAPVGIGLERSLDMVVAVLAILKAGGAYVPLDPDYPAERLSYMLEDSGATLLLTQSTLLATLPMGRTRRLNLDALQAVIGRYPEENPCASAHADHLAYIIYTSGSTDRPKAVMISRRSLVNAYYAWRDAYRLGDKPRAHLQMASLSFDVCAGDMVRALLSGDKLVICPRPLLLDAPNLYALMRRIHIRIAEFVPAVLRNLMAYLEQTRQNLAFMDLLICGSDAWSKDEYEYFQSFIGNQGRLVNSYGLTEATIDSLYYQADPSAPLDVLAVGRPFANSRAYLLDRHYLPVPVGVVGELYLAGAGLARGYRNAPELTAEKFIPDPFAAESGGRLYKTGDLARYLPSGDIEFLGRADTQVKIRGFRIEPGEIEARLLACDGVSQALVVAREDRGDKRLVAYVVVQDNVEIALAELRTQLAANLSAYMMPSAFVELPEFPLTPNGKLDRKALPCPDWQAQGQTAYAAPSSATETILAAIWTDILDVEKIGVNDDFFMLGGHSLTATQLVSRINKKFQLALSLRDVFEVSTIAGFALLIEERLIEKLEALSDDEVEHFFLQNSPVAV